MHVGKMMDTERVPILGSASWFGSVLSKLLAAEKFVAVDIDHADQSAELPSTAHIRTQTLDIACLGETAKTSFIATR